MPLGQLQSLELDLFRHVRLVERHELRHVAGADLGKHRPDRCHLRTRVGVRAVDHVHDQVRVGHFLQRRAERLDELMREVPDESDSVGQRARHAGRQPGLAHSRIERGEQRVVHQDVRPGQPVEQA